MARRRQRAWDTAALRAALTQPGRVVLARSFEFYGEGGALHRWQEGAVVTDPVEIAMLLSRKAPLKDDPQCPPSLKTA